MGRALLLINSTAARQKAKAWIDKAPWNTRVTFQGPKRSLPQNDRLWAMLTDVATQLPWHGQKMAPEDWKLIFMASLKQEMRIVPNIDGNGFVNLGQSSSNLSKAEMSELQELISAFGAQRGVVFHEPVRHEPENP